MAITELKHKRVLVLGLGRFGGGADAALFAARQGARVCVTDRAAPETLAESLAPLRSFPNIDLRLGKHENADVDTADVVIVNPAIPDSNLWVERARQQGKVVTHAVNLFFERCPATTIGITGANGKSTTAALTAHLLKALSHGRTWLSGNIGHRPLLGLLDEIQPEDRVVLELSSFQTERLNPEGGGPQVALLTNLTPNHLDRHGTFAAYAAAKEVLFQSQPGSVDHPCLSVFCGDDVVGQQWFEKYRQQGDRRCIRYTALSLPPALLSVFPLPGRANRTNLAGAWAIAQYLGVSLEQAVAQLPSFQALPHRLALVAEVGGVRWYNDSIATTPESVEVALQAFDQPKILIAGGYDKGVSFTALGRTIAARAKAVILLGQTAGALREAIGPSIPCEVVASLADAVQAARALAEPGDVVLLSPACASYDMFKNFEDRGEQFADLVRNSV